MKTIFLLMATLFYFAPVFSQPQVLGLLTENLTDPVG